MMPDEVHRQQYKAISWHTAIINQSCLPCQRPGMRVSSIWCDILAKVDACTRQWMHLLKNLTLLLWRNQSFIFSSHLHQRLRCHGRKTITWLLVTEEQSYKPQIKGKTVGRKNEKVPEDLVCLRSHWYLHLPTASALGVTGPPRKVGEPCNFLMALVFSGKLSRTWLWAQAVVHNPLNCLSINILPGTVSAHAR